MHSMHQIKSSYKSTFESITSQKTGHNRKKISKTHFNQSSWIGGWLGTPFLQLRLSWWSQGDHAHSPSAHSVWAETVNSAMDQVSISFPERSSTIHSISSRTPAKHQLDPLQFNNPNTTQESFVEEVTIWNHPPKPLSSCRSLWIEGYCWMLNVFCQLLPASKIESLPPAIPDYSKTSWPFYPAMWLDISQKS